MASDMMLSGRILIWLRPTGRTYDIRYYSKDRYRAYFDADGKMESVEIIYSYTRRSQTSFNLSTAGTPNTAASSVTSGQQSWIKIRLTDTTYERWDYLGATPGFDNADFLKAPDSVAENTLGFIPCRECLNVNYRGEQGKPEFEDLQQQIEAHNSQCEAIRNNLLEICNNPFLTSLEEEDIFEQVGSDRTNASVAYGQGFRSAEELQAEKPFNSDLSGKKIKKVIGGFDPSQGDFFTQATVAPLPPNQLGYVEEKGRNLRIALGGTPEGGVETATETRIVYGRAYVTAAKKQKSLFKYGLCEILSMALLVEENLFLASGGTIGLSTAPLNLDRRVQWRIIPAFPPSDQAELNRSIIGRNKARTGVNQLECARANFPEKSDQEIKQMLAGGVPVEYLEMLLSTAMMLQQVTDPMTGLPLTTVIPIVDYIRNALQYAGQPGSDYLDTGTAGPTKQLEQRSFDAAKRVIEYLNALQQQQQRVGSVGEEPDQSGAALPVLDSEQNLPADGAIVSDNTDSTSFWQRNFPTFSTAASAAINGIRGLGR
jgi:hypothetical protein